MQDLRVAVIQKELFWQDPEQNRSAFDRYLEGQNGHDLIVLPEMFTTGFTMHSESYYEAPGGPTEDWLKAHAVRLDSVIMGSVIVKDNGHYFNRMLIAHSDGRVEHYDKRHLFRMAGEDENFTEGKERLIIEVKGWRICPLICYDLRFPVWSRNKGDFDCIVYVANWPRPRANAWDILLQARAVENSCYVVGVNRIGSDGNNKDYIGGSAVVDFKGKHLFKMNEDEEGLQATSLTWDNLQVYREKFPVQKDADRFEIQF